MAHVITDECISCGVCVDECAVEAISEGEDKYVIDKEKCTDSGYSAELSTTEDIYEGVEYEYQTKDL